MRLIIQQYSPALGLSLLLQEHCEKRLKGFCNLPPDTRRCDKDSVNLPETLCWQLYPGPDYPGFYLP